MKTKKLLAYSFLATATLTAMLWLTQGCSQNVPTLATMAVRPSPTVCGYQPVYTFLNGPGCWQVDTGTFGATSSIGILTVSTSNAVADTTPGAYSNSLQVAVNNTGATRDAEININFSPAANLNGKEMVITLYSSVSPTGMAVQPYDFGGNKFEGSFKSITAGSWMPVTFAIGSGGANPNQVTQMGLQFKSIPAGATGDIYINSIAMLSYNTPTPTITPTITPTNVGGLTSTPTFTFTPTPTPCAFQSLYSFTSSTDCWQVDTGTFGATSSVGIVTLGVSHSVTLNYSGSLQAAITNTGTSRDAEINVNFSPAVVLSGDQMVMNIHVDSSLSGMAVQPYAFVPGFAGNYTSVTTGTWMPVSVAFGSPATISQMGLQFKSVPASSNGNVYVDAVSIVAASTSTPTPTPTP